MSQAVERESMEVDVLYVGAGPGTLLDHVMRYDGSDPAIERMIDLLASGLANPVNLIRPHRVVLVRSPSLCRSRRL